MLKSKVLIATNNFHPIGIPNTTQQKLLSPTDFKITATGTWLYKGSPIKHESLVKYLAGNLHRDAQANYWIITPQEICHVTVEDAPFTIVEISVLNKGPKQHVQLRTNINKWITASDARPIYFKQNRHGKKRPYAKVANDGTEALIMRAPYYELSSHLDIRIEGNKAIFSILSSGTYLKFDE